MQQAVILAEQNSLSRQMGSDSTRAGCGSGQTRISAPVHDIFVI